MKLFKESKHQPIKFRGFKFIGYHKDYPNACYYYKPLDRGNYELMECMLEGEKKPEVGAGTKVSVLDTFMCKYLESAYLKANNKALTGTKFVTHVIEKYFYDYPEEAQKAMIKKFNSKLPTEIGTSQLYKKYKDQGYNVLYCSNDESEDRLFGIVNLVLVKEEHIKSDDPKINIDRKYTLFKPLRFSVAPSYIKKESKNKYLEMDLDTIRVDHDILNI